MGDKGENKTNEGEMDAHNFYQCEFSVVNGMPEFIEPNVKGIEVRINGEDIYLSRLNTTVREYNPITATLYGEKVDIEYVGFDYIYVDRGEHRPPFSYPRPEEAGDAQEAWDGLMASLISLDCNYVCGVPSTADLEHAYRVRRGDEPIDNILERILEDAWD